MNIRQLETFYWIAQLGTFSAAADRLSTTQANVSARIRELEEELGVALFDRVGRQVQLTVKARELLGHAHNVVSEAAHLRLAAGKPAQVRGAIKIALAEPIATLFLVSIISGLKRRHPDADVEFTIDVNPNLVRKVSRGEVDVAVIGGPVEAPGLALIPIGAMRLIWVCPPVLWNGRESISPPDLADLPILSPPRETKLYSMIQEWFAVAGMCPRRISYCNNLATMLQAARAGVCVCPMVADLVLDDVKAGTLVAPPPLPTLGQMRFYVATRAGSVDPAVPEIASIVANNVLRLPETARMTGGNRV